MTQEIGHKAGYAPGYAQAVTSNQQALWWPIASIFCGFGIWSSWSVIVVLLLQAGANDSPSALYSLLAIGGLAGASLHIVLGFLTPPSLATPGNARGLLILTTGFLLLPAALTGGLLHIASAPLWMLQLLALLCGLGGGSFSVFIICTTQQYPRPQQAVLLSLGTGLGHLGIVASQLFLPLIVGVSLWGSLQATPVFRDTPLFQGTPLPHEKLSSFLGNHPTPVVWLSQAGVFWAILLLLLLLAAVFVCRRPEAGWLTSLRTGGGMLLIGFLISAAGLWLTLPPEAHGSGLQLSRELVLVAMVLGLLVLLRVLSGRPHQLHVLFNHKHTWAMSGLYAMSLGSFLGLACALPLTLELLFGYTTVSGQRELNANAPGVFTYVWMGPLVGVLTQPMGNWLARRFGSGRVIQVCALVMLLVAIACARLVYRAYHASEPEQFFLSLLMLMLVWFAAAGASYAAISLLAQRLFSYRQGLQARLWLTGVASYGMFYIPHLLGEQLMRGTPEQAFVGFALFYALCLLVNGWFYGGKGGTSST